jgi:branched-chain amino acid transport system substrate-binding protein
LGDRIEALRANATGPFSCLLALYRRPVVRAVTSRKTVLALLVLLAAAVGGGCGDEDTDAQKPIEIGALFSLTGLGNVYGPQQADAARLAIAQINAAGGVNGAKLRLRLVDDGSDPARGTQGMRDLIERQHVAAVLGPSLSLVAVHADPVADRLRTPVLAVSNTAGGIVGKCDYPCTWIWRDSLGEATAIPAVINAYLARRSASTSAILATGDDVLGEYEADVARSAFASSGVQVLADVRIPPRDVDRRTIGAYVTRALADKPQILFIGTTFGAIAAEAMRIAREQGFTGAILGGNTLNSATTTRAAGAAGRGARSGAAWYADNDFPANVAFIRAYRDAYHRTPDQFAAQAYAGVQILASALSAAGDVSGRPIAEVRQALQDALPDVALTTPLGPFRFTPSHDVAQVVWILAMDGRGGHDLVGFCNPQC